MTNVFVLDGNGGKRRLAPQDFGRGVDETFGRRVQGLGRPPPTQMIVVPEELLTSEEVVAYAEQEKRTFAWQLELMGKVGRVLLDRLLTLSLRLLDWTSERLGRAVVHLQSRLQQLRDDPTTMGWSEDETKVIPGRRRPSVS